MAINNGKVANAKVHMSTVYSRKKKTIKRTFSLVIGGLLIITTSLLGCANAEAILSPKVSYQPSSVGSQAVQVDKVEIIVEDGQARIKNLEILIKVLNENGLSVKALTNMQSSCNC